MHACLMAGVLILSSWVHVPQVALLGLKCIIGSLLVIVAANSDRIRRYAIVFAWLCTPLGLWAIPLTPKRLHILDIYYSVIAALVSLAAFIAVQKSAADAARKWVKLLALSWAYFAAFICLAAAYLQNNSTQFSIGLLGSLALLIVTRNCFSLSTIGIQVIHTAILIVIGLPLIDLVTRPTSSIDAHVALANRYYSYRVARQNPAAFYSWWRSYLLHWDLMGRDVYAPDPTGVFPFRLRPSSNGFLFDCPIHINSKGFRGREFTTDKGEAYRIVTIGESTTFGVTLQRDDRPWPEVLEQLIREQIPAGRPVEVINAGVPAYNLQHNLVRLREDILPLKPDMIISYHGANGFYLLDAALPKPFGQLPPAYQRRPVKLLADCEYRLKMIRFRKQLDPKRLLDPTGFSNPLKTKYADAYRELIQIARTNNIRLVLGNYAMAVNSQSDSDVVEFYRTASPSIHWQIRANAVHTELVKELCQQNPEISFVDTHPNLDGDTEKFIDMGHLTQPGRNQMAQNFFKGIKPILESELQKRSPEQKSIPK